MLWRIPKCSFNYQSTLNAKGFNYVNTLTDPANYDGFYLEYLETSLVRYTGEDLVNQVGADFTI